MGERHVTVIVCRLHRFDAPIGFINHADEHGFTAHNPAAIGALPKRNGGGGPLCSCRQGVLHVLNTLLALLAVAVVMAAHGLAKLVLLPFWVLGGLFRHKGSQAQLTAR